MNSIFFIISFLSVISLQAAEEAQKISDFPTGFNLIRVLQYEDETVLTITDESNGKTERVPVPKGFFEEIEFDIPNKKELEIKVAQLQQEVADKQRILDEYQAVLQRGVETIDELITPRSIEHAMIPACDEESEHRGSVFTELLQMRVRLKPTEKAHPAQILTPDKKEESLQEALEKAFAQKFNKAQPHTGDDESTAFSDSE